MVATGYTLADGASHVTVHPKSFRGESLVLDYNYAPGHTVI